MDTIENTDLQETQNKKIIGKLNIGIYLLIGFTILYSIFMLAAIRREDMRDAEHHPYLLIDPNTMTISSTYTNLLPKGIILNGGGQIIGDGEELDTVNVNELSSPLLTKKEDYVIGEFVIINYFYIRGIISEMHPNSKYTVIYKDQNRVIQSVVLDQDFLLYPANPRVIDPLSFLVD